MAQQKPQTLAQVSVSLAKELGATGGHGQHRESRADSHAGHGSGSTDDDGISGADVRLRVV